MRKLPEELDAQIISIHLLKDSSVPATQPIKQGNAPGIAPTNTAMEFTFFRGVYINAYRNKLKADNPADSQLK